MIEKNREEQAAEARVSKMLAEALAEDLGDIPKVSITVEELKALERADRRQRRKRKLRYFSMAAAAVLICVVALYALWPETAVPVSADKNTEHRVEEGNGEIIINEGDGAGHAGMSKITETDWDKVEEIKCSASQLAIPTSIPKGYAFETLTVEMYGKDDFLAQYSYKKGTECTLYIEQKNYAGTHTKATIAEGQVKNADTQIGKVYFVQGEQEPPTALCYLENGYLNVTGELTKDEVIRIFNGIEL